MPTNNPAVIKDLLLEIVKNDFDGSHSDAARKMSETALISLTGKRSYKPLTDHMLKNILADKSQIKFSQLEIISAYLGVPTGVFLIFTRLRAAKRDGDRVDEDYLKAVYQMLGEAFVAESLSLQLLRDIGSGSQQLELKIE